MLNKKIVRISFCFLICVAMLCSSCPIAFASDSEIFYVNISKPTVSNNSGYFEMLWQNNTTGSQFVSVDYFTFTPFTNGSSEFLSSADQLLTKLTVSSSEVLFNISVPEYVWGYYSLVSIDSRGEYSITAHPLSDDGGSVTYRASRNGYTLVGFRYYGNVSDCTNYLSSNEVFYVSYSEDTVLNFHLADIITSLNSISSSIGDSNSEIKSSLDTLVSDLNSFEGSFEEFVAYYKTQMGELLNLIDSFLDKFDTLIENTDDVELYLENTYYLIESVESYCRDIYYEITEFRPILNRIDSKLQTIIDLLNAGKNEPTLKNPNESIDSAFNDVSGWFGEIDGFGDQLEQNRQENQENLAQAGNIINGFFSVVPPQILVALALCAILIVVAKVIGR